jgi:hypothetical protein
VPDAVVHGLEVVDVEDHQREPARVAVRAGALAREGLVEVAPVVEPGECVEVGELARLAELQRVLDRGRRVLGQPLEVADVLLAEAAGGIARVDGEVADPAALGLERHRHAAVDQAGLRRLLGVVAVGDLDRAGPRPVRRPRDRLGSVDGEASCRHRRRALGSFEPHERGVDAFQPRAGLERPGENLVEVDRARDVREEPAPPALLLRPVDRGRELTGELVHPLFEGLHDLADALVGLPAGAPGDDHEQGRENDDGRTERRRDDRKDVVHRS